MSTIIQKNPEWTPEDFKQAIAHSVANMLGANSQSVGQLSNTNSDQSTKIFAPDTEVRINKTTIDMGLFNKKVPTVSVQTYNSQSCTTEVYFNPKELSRYGKDGYLRWAIVLIEQHRALSPDSIYIKGDMPAKLTEAMASYCKYKGYECYNHVTSFVAEEKHVKAIAERLNKNQQIILKDFSKEQKRYHFKVASSVKRDDTKHSSSFFTSTARIIIAGLLPA